MLTGPNGLLSQADEAGTSTNRAGAKEKVQVEVLGSYGTDGNIELKKLNDNLLNIPNIKKYNKDGEATELTKNNPIEELPANVEVDGYIFEISDVGVVTEKGKGSDPTSPAGDEVTVGEIVEGSNKTYTDKDEDTAVIPVGFAIVPDLDDVSEGLVISDVADDREDEGNQFVWIPVNGNYEATTTYENTKVSAAVIPDEEYLPTGVNVPAGKSEEDVERDLVTTDLVEKYGVKGFYISRYEAGKESTNTLVSKKMADIWVDILQETAKYTATTFVVKDDTKVKSGLCTGIQWDMAMAFVNGKNDGEGNPYLVETYSSSRHNSGGAVQNSADIVCNIYDLEGNCYEYVAEMNTYLPYDPYVFRGGAWGSTVIQHLTALSVKAFLTSAPRSVSYFM